MLAARLIATGSLKYVGAGTQLSLRVIETETTDTPATAAETIDSPDANGRLPETGETKWRLKFPLENGDQLELSIGQNGHDALQEMPAQEAAEDAEREGLTCG